MKESKTGHTDCDKYRALFQDYIEGKLDARSKISIQSHIAYCEDCSKYLDDLVEKQLDKEAAAGVVWPDPPFIPSFDLYDKFIRGVIENQWRELGRFKVLDRLVPRIKLASLRKGYGKELLEKTDEQGFRIGGGVEVLANEEIKAVAYIGSRELLYITLYDPKNPGLTNTIPNMPIAICKRKADGTIVIEKNLIKETDKRGAANFGSVDDIPWPEPGESYILKVAHKPIE